MPTAIERPDAQATPSRNRPCRHVLARAQLALLGRRVRSLAVARSRRPGRLFGLLGPTRRGVVTDARHEEKPQQQ